MGRYQGIGLMSGTSLDGIDLAYCTFSETDAGWELELGIAETVPMEEQWYARLKCLDTADARTYARTDVYWGHYLGRVVQGFVKRHGLRPQFVASHGQTIFHQPQKNYTAQIGDGESMVTYLDCPLVTNFRNGDVALGGQGAPLVPFAERLLFPGHELFLNLGGFANLSAPDGAGGVLAFDVTVCNMGLNWLCRNLDPPLPYDPDGQLARSGRVDTALLEALDGLAYFGQAPPKSLGTEWFEAEVLPLLAADGLPVADRLRTLTEHVARRTAADLSAPELSGKSLMVTGGGARNGFLVERLADCLKPRGISLAQVPEALVDFKEAVVFAFLGLQTLLGRPNVLASVTGARLDHLGGSIHLPPHLPGRWSLL